MTEKKEVNRRNFLCKILTASACLSEALSLKQKYLNAQALPETNKNGMPYGTIGNLKISRLILGSNVMGGGAHARDLNYVSKLMKAYNTKERVLNVLEISESLGINTILQGSPTLIREYNEKRGGKMRHIRPVRIIKEDDEKAIQKKIREAMGDLTAAVYVFGCSCDFLAYFNRVDVIGKALDIAKKEGVLMGVGGHSLKVVTECERLGLKPAFYVKTFHHDKYWSATPKENRKDFCWYKDNKPTTSSGKQLDHNKYHDNIWDLDSEKTAKVMKKVKVPWIAFKILAAGAISPFSGFKYAFNNGADFIAVGMLDFQIKEDVKILKGLFARGFQRERLWRS